MRTLCSVILAVLGLMGLALASPHASAVAQTTVDLAPSLPSGQPVGTVVTWQVTAPAGDRLNQFSISHDGGAFEVIVGYTPERRFDWVTLEEGSYLVGRESRGRVTNQVATVDEPFFIAPRVQSAPGLFATDHPLVALYSVPACPPGAASVRVSFRRDASFRADLTSDKPCIGDRTINFYVGGRRATSTYWLNHILLDANGGLLQSGAPISFETGVPDVDWGTVTTQLIQPAQTSLAEPLLLHSVIGRNVGPHYTIATDFAGELVWYYDPGITLQSKTYLTRMLSGGSGLFLMPNENNYAQVVREVDLAGNVVGQTDVQAINLQLTDMGWPAIGGIHHDAIRLDNGHTVVIAAYERFVEDLQGPGLVNVLGDMVIDLDENWQVTWVWDSFEHLDLSRRATLRERCWTTCDAPLQNGPVANDWTHSNTVDYSASDGNLIVSVRNQDWVVKLDYQDGTGSGEILWRLGLQGDFTIDPPTPLAWFTHQHDTRYLSDQDIIVYDNGTLRCKLWDHCVSRGQVYRLDEDAMTATLVVNVNLDKYASALGAAQRLINGNFHFSSGTLLDEQGHYISHSDELTVQSDLIYETVTEGAVYRSYRLRDLYTAPQD